MIQDLLSRKPYLAWSVRDKKSLSEESALEQILNFGDWQDYLKAEKELGIQKVKAIFKGLKNKKRTNLRPKTINYFNLYFDRHA